MKSELFLGSAGIKRVGSALYSGFSGSYPVGSCHASGLLFGFSENFLGKKCISGAGTISNGATTNGSVHLQVGGCMQPLFVTTSADAALAASATITTPASGLNHGTLSLSTVGTNAKACVAGFLQEDVAGTANEWLSNTEGGVELNIVFHNMEGNRVPVTQGLRQFGFCGDVLATFQSDILGAAATDGVYAQIEMNKIYLVVKRGAVTTKSSEYLEMPVDSRPLQLRLAYRVGSGIFRTYLTTGCGTISQEIMTGTPFSNRFQIFGRVGHSAAYDSTISDKCVMDIDSISVNLIEGIGS